MKRAYTRQRMTNDNNNKNLIKKFNTSENPSLLSYATTITLKFKLK